MSIRYKHYLSRVCAVMIIEAVSVTYSLGSYTIVIVSTPLLLSFNYFIKPPRIQCIS